MEMKELSSILQQNGIVGAGGAGFPTYAKLNENENSVKLKINRITSHIAVKF